MTKTPTLDLPYVVIRTYSAGVHIGFLARLDENTQTVELIKARRLYKWTNALSLSEVSKNGVGNESKLFEEIEVLFTTSEAKNNLRTLKAYNDYD